ncbi:MAG: M28 family peptidase [Planctomycetota bacterium]
MNLQHDRLAQRSLLLLLCYITLLCSGCAAVQRQPRIAESISSITPDRCEQELSSFLELGSRACWKQEETAATIDFLTRKLESWGYQVIREPLDLPRYPGNANLIVEKIGNSEPDQILEIGAHFDSVGNLGADDNGSGVIGVLEAARVFSTLETGRTVRFCLYACEEVGLLGSRHHVQQILAEPEEEFVGLINFEMIGYTDTQDGSQGAPIRIPFLADLPHTGDFILVAGNFSSGWLGNRIEAHFDSYEPQLKYYSANRISGFFADAARSDHSPYWEAGLDAIMLTDTANFRNPHYHEDSDTIETLDFEFMARIIRAVTACAIDWAGTSFAP